VRAAAALPRGRFGRHAAVPANFTLHSEAKIDTGNEKRVPLDPSHRIKCSRRELFDAMDMEQMWSARLSSTDLNGPEPRPTAPLLPAKSRFPQVRALVGPHWGASSPLRLVKGSRILAELNPDGFCAVGKSWLRKMVSRLARRSLLLADDQLTGQRPSPRPARRRRRPARQGLITRCA
jgi:hypothetical protein